VPTGTETHRLKLSYSDVLSALSGDGRLAATWTHLGQTVQIWDLASSNLLQELPTRDVSVQVAFSPTSEWLVVGDGAEYRAWDCHTWRTRFVLSRTAASFWGRMAFCPDSSILAAAITRSILLLVDGVTGRELATLEAPERMNISGIAFSPDGTQLAVTTGVGPVQLWNIRAIRTQLATMNLDWDLPPYR
jgi:WD40 repeat protein